MLGFKTVFCLVDCINSAVTFSLVSKFQILLHQVPVDFLV